MIKSLSRMMILMMLFLQTSLSTVEANGVGRDKLLKTYESNQKPADLRLYYMVKSRLKTRNDKIYFLNLSLRDKKVYTKYLLNNSDVRFKKNTGYSLFF